MNENPIVPPTPLPADTDFQLELPLLEIPDVITLRLLMDREKDAVAMVHSTIKSFQEPGMHLVGADGKPVMDIALRMDSRITGWINELAALPTVAAEWAACPTASAREGGISTTSWALAYTVYQQFARALMHFGLKELIENMDVAFVGGLNALHHGRTPLEAYKVNFRIQAETEDGTVDLGNYQHVLDAKLVKLQGCFLTFLRSKNWLQAGPAPDTPETLTMEAVRLLEHLMAVLGCMESMKRQGPALVEALMAKDKPGEQLTEAKLRQDLSKAPNTVTRNPRREN